METIRVGIVGLGANTRSRHLPGLRACEAVQVTGVCNRSAESTARAAEEFEIPRSFENWQQLVQDPDLDAVVIGTWPYLHCPITLAALDAGKHVLTEARMAMNASEAHAMFEASERHPDLVTQIVPSPLGLRAHQVVLEILESGRLGPLREIAVLATGNAYADSQAPLHWRQSSELSGLNALAMGIVHEPLARWVPDPIELFAQESIFTSSRPDPETLEPVEVGTPDSMHILTRLPGGTRGIYHISGVLHGGPSPQVHLYGEQGTLKYLMAPQDQLLLASADGEFEEVEVPADKAGGWRVEEEFVGAIRGQEEIEFNDFSVGVRYMEFTEAVTISARERRLVTLPLENQ
jgi:predicted dehydrogenase